jgi:amino acid adenylation domain-containing protein
MDGAWNDLRALVLSSGQQHADRPALWVDDCLYSYGELIRHGAGLAHVIASTKRRTAIFADRHFWSYAGIIGAVLAGHAYVPVNPRHPMDRLETMLRSADVGALILDHLALVQYRPLIEALPPCRIVVPDAEQLPDWVVGSPHRFIVAADLRYDLPTPVITADDGAYLLFTSGSTGTPKGVMVKQANVIAYLRTMIARYAMTPEDRVTQLFDLTFDLSVHDMFVTWGAGGTLYCPSDNVRKYNPRMFAQRHALTGWFSTPSTIALMSRLHMLSADCLPSLRVSLFCGEALPTRLAAEWVRAAPQSLVENIYGPTEATIAITAYRLPVNLTDLPEIVPIGQPLPGQLAAVFDEQGRSMPNGEAGELWLSGSQVTDGYWQQPDLTKERFVWYNQHRWYRTGDRAICDAAGLRFLGRLDRQVKISGYRVELAEIEAALRQAAACDSVAALAWPVDANGLAHGVVALIAAESRPDTAILAACCRTLAPYMVPSRLVRLTEWPLNTNGKTDYRALHNLLDGA